MTRRLPPGLVRWNSERITRAVYNWGHAKTWAVAYAGVRPPYRVRIARFRP